MNHLIFQIILFILTIVGISVALGVTTTELSKKLDDVSARVTAVEKKQQDAATPSPGTPKPVILFSSQLSPALDFFGDSITVGFRVSSTERWSSLVSTFLGKVENNFGFGGDQWLDAAAKIYNSHTPGNSVFFNYGINDIARGQHDLEEMKRAIYAYIIYCTLPAANIVNARKATMTPNGWENTGAYNTVGVMTAPASNGSFPGQPAISATVAGRYIGFAATVVNSADVNNNWGLIISVDSSNVNLSTPTPFFNAQPTSVNGSGFAPYLYIYDTGDATPGQSHVISLQPTVKNNYGDRAFCDYFFGFDAGMKGTNPVTILQPTHFDYRLYDSNQSPPAGNYAMMTAYNTLLKEIVRDLSDSARYNLPVMLVADPLPYDMGYTSFDLVHPTPYGHKQIASNVINTLQQPIASS